MLLMLSTDERRFTVLKQFIMNKLTYCLTILHNLRVYDDSVVLRKTQNACKCLHFFPTFTRTQVCYLITFSELLHLYSPSRSLRSATDTRIFRVPRMGRRTLGGRSFQYIGPVIWLVECCFTSTETVGLLGTGAQDGHLDFDTAPDLSTCDLELSSIIRSD